MRTIHTVGIAFGLALAVAVAGCGTGTRREATSSQKGSVNVSYSVYVSRPIGGTIRSSDGRLVCPSTSTTEVCGPVDYAWDQPVTFTASANDGYKFSFWAADCSGSGECSVGTATYGADKWIAAAFVPAATYQGTYFLVAANRPTNGKIVSDDGSIRCGTALVDSLCGPVLYPWTADVVLTATGDVGYALAAWTGDCAKSGVSGELCRFSPTDRGDKLVGATFGKAIGNELKTRAFASDYPVGAGQQAPVLVVLRSALPESGSLAAFRTWNQATTGSSPFVSAGNVFYALVLRPTGPTNEYSVAFKSNASFKVPPLTVAERSEPASFPLPTPFAVLPGDLIAFYGQGVPLDTGGSVADFLVYKGTTNPVPEPSQGGVITLGVDPYPIYSEDRTYSFGAVLSAP